MKFEYEFKKHFQGTIVLNIPEMSQQNMYTGLDCALFMCKSLQVVLDNFSNNKDYPAGDCRFRCNVTDCEKQRQGILSFLFRNGL